MLNTNVTIGNIMAKKIHKGQLLIASPANPQDTLYQSVILILAHTSTTAIGVQINRPIKSLSIKSLARTQGLTIQDNQPLWYGGNVDSGKIHVIHTSDWSSAKTTKYNDEISVTSDLSILAAIADGTGPEYYRACAGYWIWERGMLDQQLSTDKANKSTVHNWEIAPSAGPAVFEDSGVDQWLNNLEDFAQYKIDTWFHQT
jgi:putative transcriptional regulator